MYIVSSHHWLWSPVILFHVDVEYFSIFCGFGSIVSTTTSLPLLRGKRKCNASVQIIKHTDSRLKLWSTSHSSGLHHKFLFHPLFDITVNPRVQIHTEYENVYQLKSKQNWCTADKELRDEKNGAQRHILETIFYWGQEKHLSDSSHTSRKLSMLSECLSVCTGGPVVTQVTGGDVLQFGLIPFQTFEMLFCDY